MEKQVYVCNCKDSFSTTVGTCPNCNQKYRKPFTDEEIQEGVQMVNDKIAEAEMTDHRNWMIEQSKKV